MYAVVVAGMQRKVYLYLLRGGAHNVRFSRLSKLTKDRIFRHSGAFVQKPFTLFQVIAVDADPRNLAYLRASLELNNSTSNVRILYNAVRLE